MLEKIISGSKGKTCEIKEVEKDPRVKKFLRKMKDSTNFLLAVASASTKIAIQTKKNRKFLVRMCEAGVEGSSEMVGGS